MRGKEKGKGGGERRERENGEKGERGREEGEKEGREQLCFFGPDHQRGNPEAVTVTPKEKHCDDTGRPTMVVVVVLVFILAAAIFYFLGGKLKEKMAAWFKGNCLRSQVSGCPEAYREHSQ